MNTNLTGVWVGECVYNVVQQRPDDVRVAFTLELHQGWFGRLSGFIRDDPAKGAPEPAPIKGKVLDDEVSFVMSRPVYYVMVGEKMIPIEEYIKQAWNMPLDKPVVPYEVFYEGAVSVDGAQMTGTWHIPPGVIQFISRGRQCDFPGPGGSGKWNVTRCL